MIIDESLLFIERIIAIYTSMKTEVHAVYHLIRLIEPLEPLPIWPKIYTQLGPTDQIYYIF